MAKIIEFYVPQNFKKDAKRVPQIQRVKTLEFPLKQTRRAVQGHRW